MPKNRIKTRANKKLYRGIMPPVRSSFPLVEELMLWIKPKPGELANKISKVCALYK